MKDLPKDKVETIAQWIDGDYEVTLQRTDKVVEGFTYHTILGQTIRWNVTQAQEEVKAGHVLVRTEIDRPAMQDIANANEWTEEGVADADPSIDGIAAPLLAMGTVIYVLIDGTHRLVRAMRDGKPFFAKLLTDDANRRCVVSADEGMVP